jgi:hypothetical protein
MAVWLGGGGAASVVGGWQATGRDREEDGSREEEDRSCREEDEWS